MNLHFTTQRSCLGRDSRRHCAKKAEGSEREYHRGAAPQCQGFALVVVLFFLAILLGGIVVLASFVTLSQRSGSAQRHVSSAQQSALFGLNVALGELQSAAGPDTRVTAPASVLGGAPIAGQAAWTGVWKSFTGSGPNWDPVNPPAREFNPASPDVKSFVGWLVSATNSAGNFAMPTNVLAPTLATTLNAAQTVTLFTNPDGTPLIKAGKVQIDDVPGGRRYFAFAVEDEGVKASLSWSETPATTANNTAERAQISRLSAAPGPDYAAINGADGPFTALTYPLSIANNNAFLTNAIASMRDPADLQVSMNATASWIKDQRPNITWGSKGVLTDVKQGGLRRDLSLAFEMDGTADVSATSQPTKFNAQVGEFVGGTDRLAAPQVAPGMPVRERFLYRDLQGSGTPFSSSTYMAPSASSVVRGPNWWALRDYANLYKRLRRSGDNYTLTARNYYPDKSAPGGWSLGPATAAGSGANSWDKEFNTQNPAKYIHRPARGNYAPVLLGSVYLFSVLATNPTATTADLALGVDALFYLWNPFNRTLNVDKLAIFADYGIPGRITFSVTRGGIQTNFGSADIRGFFLEDSGPIVGGNHQVSYLISNLVMAPGEVVVVSPSSNRSATATPIHDEAIPGNNINNASGIVLTKFPRANLPSNSTSAQSPHNWAPVTLDISPTSTDAVSMQYIPDAGSGFLYLRTTLPRSDATAIGIGRHSDWFDAGSELQALDTRYSITNPLPNEYLYLQNPPAAPYAANTLVNTKNFFGINTYLMKPANHVGNNPNPVEVFSRFNPAPVGSTVNDVLRICHMNQIFNYVSMAGGANTLLQQVGIGFPATALNNGFWGASYTSSGSTALPMKDIPSAPILSLAAFSHAALATRTSEPFHAVGNSWASVFVPPIAPYSRYAATPGSPTASDSSWLLNDALFDRYYLSGIAPAFTIGAGGYSQTGSITETLTSFFSEDYKSALANPVLRPYLPPGQTAGDAISALAADIGYKKLGAYSLIDGAFNVNSTSVAAWTAFLRANRNLAVNYAEGGSDIAEGTPFPRGTSPSSPNGSPFWSGLSRLTDAQISTLATEIVNQVKLRGPFMSLSDFVNHRVGTPQTPANDMGALQAAIEAANINSAVKDGAGGTTPVYTTPGAPAGSGAQYFMPGGVTPGSRTTTTGIPGDITQADLLLSLAPRLAARSDTFRIRSYGEVRSTDGARVIAQAACEAIVQRVPEYMDPVNNEPWDEGANLNTTNQTFGRRFKVVSFRWLSPNEL